MPDRNDMLAQSHAALALAVDVQLGSHVSPFFHFGRLSCFSEFVFSIVFSRDGDLKKNRRKDFDLGVLRL